MEKMNRAIILVAGLGKRLMPITGEMPKCMTEINGVSILENSLKILNSYDIKETMIVIGYLGQKIIDAFGNRYGNMKIVYRWNKDYEMTNSMYSAWLARHFLEKGAYLIEGDVMFSKDCLEKVQQFPNDESCWIVDKFGPDNEGSMSVTDKEGRIVKIKIVREKLDRYRDNFFKSSGILKICPKYGKKFSSWLTQEVERGNTNIYYDLVIAKHLNDMPIYAQCINGKNWIEIDSLLDLKKAEHIFQPRKYVVVIIDGSADVEVPELGNKTPFEVANIPTIDWLALNGTTGLMQTSYSALPIGSIVANMGILGYVPNRYYPSGRASFEAMAQAIFLDHYDIAFRCNLISLNEGREISDFTAGRINDNAALKVLNSLTLKDDGIEIYSGQSYRNILIIKNANCIAQDIVSFEPHTHIGIKIDDILLKGKTQSAQLLADRLNSLMLDSMEKLKEVNKKHNTPADMIWLWSASSSPRLPAFTQKYGIRGAVVAGLDFMRGIGMAAGMATKEIHGATGYLDTNLKEKLKYVKNYLQYNDFVYIHINAADEESHAHNVKNKIYTIERVENEVVAPLVDYLNKQCPNNYRIAILPDHYTRLSDGQHTNDPVPYLIYGDGIRKDSVKMYDEKSVKRNSTHIIKSYEFMKELIS